MWNPEVLGEVLALSCSFYSKNGKQVYTAMMEYGGNGYIVAIASGIWLTTELRLKLTALAVR